MKYLENEIRDEIGGQFRDWLSERFTSRLSSRLKDKIMAQYYTPLARQCRNQVIHAVGVLK